MTREAEIRGGFSRHEARRPRDENHGSGLEGGLRALASLSLRQGLKSGRWTVVESYQQNGELYVVARRDEATVPLSTGLSLRERQAVRHATQGLTNKVIAYEMGISASTVGVLLHRAARKLACRTRADLLEKFREIDFTPPGASLPCAAHGIHG